MVFNRDMLINVPLLANLIAIRRRRQQYIDENLRRVNAKRSKHVYVIGDKIEIRIREPFKKGPKLHSKWKGPYTLTQIYTNGNVQIRFAPHITQMISIRKIRPFKGTINEAEQNATINDNNNNNE